MQNKQFSLPVNVGHSSNYDQPVDLLLLYSDLIHPWDPEISTNREKIIRKLELQVLSIKTMWSQLSFHVASILHKCSNVDMKKLKPFSRQRRKACAYVWETLPESEQLLPIIFQEQTVFLFCKIQRLCHSHRINLVLSKKNPFTESAKNEEESHCCHSSVFFSMTSSFVVCLTLLQNAFIVFKSTRFWQDSWHRKHPSCLMPICSCNPFQDLVSESMTCFNIHPTNLVVG